MPPICRRCGHAHMWGCDDGGFQGSPRPYPMWRKVRRWIFALIWKHLRIDFTAKNILHWYGIKEFKARRKLHKAIKERWNLENNQEKEEEGC